MLYNRSLLKQYVNAGKFVEECFSKDLLSDSGGEVKFATAKEDMQQHIDLFWRANNANKWASFDVKGMKKETRSDKNVSPHITWLELKNVNGDKGSLMGDANYMVFEAQDVWYLVRRQELLNKLLGKMVDNTIYEENPGADFKYYQRKNRKDLIVRVPFSFITDNAVKTVKKTLQK